MRKVLAVNKVRNVDDLLDPDSFRREFNRLLVSRAPAFILRRPVLRTMASRSQTST